MTSSQDTAMALAITALAESQKGLTLGKKRRKTVTFTDAPSDCRRIENLDQLSDEEKALVWFTREEFAAIKASYQEIIHMTRNKEFVKDSEKHCTRGLECRSKAGSRRRRDTQLNALIAVLTEQDRQRKHGVAEPDTLAVMYRQYSYHSQQAATNMGRRDEMEILEYTSDTQVEFGVRLQCSASRNRSNHNLMLGRRSSTGSHSPRAGQRSSRVNVMLGGPSVSHRRASTGSRRRAAAA